jgi:hypothetical protein
MAYTREDLVVVDLHVAEGEQHVARQRQIVQQVAADPRLRELAERLLAELEAVLNGHRQQREIIRARLRIPPDGES